eukprot:1393932-Amphidinium_carterae.3
MQQQHLKLLKLLKLLKKPFEWNGVASCWGMCKAAEIALADGWLGRKFREVAQACVARASFCNSIHTHCAD